MISFRKMKKSDISQIIKWIRNTHVLTYWVSAQNETDETIRLKYEKRLNNNEIDTFIILLKNEPIGLIQTYFLEKDNEFSLEEISKGVDLFIGEKKFIDKGYGTKILKTFISDFVFSDPTVQFVGIDPEVANERAIHVYEKIGFKTIRIGYDKHSKLLTCYMILKRQSFFDN